MEEESGVRATELVFFTALLKADAEELEGVLADDFLLIDVMSGSEVTKPDILALVGSGQLKFDAIEPADTRVRLYGTTAIVTGRTRMSMRFEETPFTVSSRYTHVYVQQQGVWRLVTAQGTQITPPP